MQQQGSLFNDADIISRYTRAQAIEDGVLVDVSETSEFRELGFRIPVALTSAVLERCIEVPEGVMLQDWHGRLWDLLWMLRAAIYKSKGRDRVNFGVHVRNDNSAGTPPLVALKAVCGPGDDGEPCITVMLPDED
jgi:hypothetical protein